MHQLQLCIQHYQTMLILRQCARERVDEHRRTCGVAKAFHSCCETIEGHKSSSDPVSECLGKQLQYAIQRGLQCQQEYGYVSQPSAHDADADVGHVRVLVVYIRPPAGASRPLLHLTSFE